MALLYASAAISPRPAINERSFALSGFFYLLDILLCYLWRDSQRFRYISFLTPYIYKKDLL
jgi:hypothetical protein